METKERLIVALDYHDMDKVKNLVKSLGQEVVYYKVGMELFYSVGASAVTYLKEQGKKVFVDLKLYDIPNTTAGGLCSLLRLGADMLNVHASGGSKMMRMAREQVAEEAARLGRPVPEIIGVTVLTSISAEDWREMGHSHSIEDKVKRLTQLTHEAGLSGVVASPKEAALIRSMYEDFLIVTPGIRPAGSGAGDQARIATPASAIRSGATHIVVGRPIREAKDPSGAAAAILAEIEAACKEVL